MNTVRQTLIFRAARAWLKTEPGDRAASMQFKFDLVHADPRILGTADVLGFVCGVEDDTTVQVILHRAIMTIDTANEELKVEPLHAGFLEQLRAVKYEQQLMGIDK